MYILFEEFLPTYKRESGLFVINLDDIPLPKDFVVQEKSIVSIPALEKGGNHKHPRIEIMVGIGDQLYIMWKDEKGNICEETMNPSGLFRVFTVPAYVPHAVVNRSSVEKGILIEFANAVQEKVETVQIA